MKLLTNDEYKKIEKILYNNKETAGIIYNSIENVKQFFSGRPHIYFLENYYLNRDKYKNRYPSNSSMLRKICKDLYIQEPTRI